MGDRRTMLQRMQPLASTVAICRALGAGAVAIYRALVARTVRNPSIWMLLVAATILTACDAGEDAPASNEGSGAPPDAGDAQASSSSSEAGAGGHVGAGGQGV